MSRFPLVLGAVVSSYHPDRQSPLFGIFSLWKFLSSDRTLAFDIGPKQTWYQSAREYRLLTDEALRTLRSEFPKEELADRLLRAVPESNGRQLLTSDTPHSWMEGRHPQKPWVWYFPDVFYTLDNPPGIGGEKSEGEKLDAACAKQLLHGWRAIDEVLGLSQIYPKLKYDERRRKLAYLNQCFGGPIKTGRSGSQPVVNRSKLIMWWNSLEDLAEDQKARIRDKEATLQSRHPYGRSACIIPEISGSMKRRKSRSRKPNKS
jgi:hypothetical protein